MKNKELNPWDDEIVPRKKLDEISISRSKLRNVQREIGQMSRKRSPLNTYQKLTVYLKRSLQLSYIEPWFQFFLPPKLKGKLFIATIGKRYWVIGTPISEFGTAFTFYQKEIHRSLENHLNKISKKKWKIPPFRITVMPENPNDRSLEKELEALMMIKSVPMKSKAEKYQEALQSNQSPQKEGSLLKTPVNDNVSNMLSSLMVEVDSYKNRYGKLHKVESDE